MHMYGSYLIQLQVNGIFGIGMVTDQLLVPLPSLASTLMKGWLFLSVESNRTLTGNSVYPLF